METPPKTRELIILDQIEQNPDVKQTTLALHLGVAVGTVNWHIKRFIEKGYVKVKRAQRRKLRYIITPEGLALRARLTVDLAEVIRLTCLEQGVKIEDDPSLPALEIEGWKIRLNLEGE